MRKLAQLFYVLFLLVLTLIPFSSKSQVYINEFQASNTGAIVDPDYKESADWIELYNDGTSGINIGGYYLSDNFNDHIKWQIPEGTQIEAKGFLLIWADGYDTGLHTNFKISADGEELVLYAPGDILIDSVSFGAQEPNMSMGRKTDGGNTWSFFIQTTPGSENSMESFAGVVQNAPIYSVLGGIFTSPVSIQITNTFGGEIRYTTDGSEPTENSALVNNTIQINNTTIIRARIFQNGKVPGKIVTQTYFIDANHEIGSLPVISLASDPENFWDAEKGIYVQDFKPEWEIPINIELFENDGSDRAAFNLTAGTKVNGLYSWQLPQKMLGIYFRKEYGEGKLDYPLLFDHNRKSFDSFALRASGSDWANTMFRDGMTQSLSAENMDVDFQGFRACVVYINGQYMGIHNIRSKVDEDFILQNHDLDGQNIDMIENESYVEAGSLDQYTAFEKTYHKDLTNQANYDAVAAQMDIENFTDFMVTEIYSQNTSVDHNIMAWKPQDSGKWKWILNDLDRGFFKPGSNMISFYAGRDVIPLSQLLTNDNYRKYFGKRMADHLFTTFDPTLVKSTIDVFAKNIEAEIPKHIIRWEGTSSSYGNPIPTVEYWDDEVAKMKSFAAARPAALLDDLKNYGFDQSESLSIRVFPEEAGWVTFNGIEIKQAFSQGAYPINEEISLIANSKSGSIFKGWAKSESKIIVAKEEIWKYNDLGNEIAANWMSSEFNDSKWSEGQAELGYGDGDEKTVVGYRSDSGNKNITTYFRKSFSIENSTAFNNLKIALKCDDGAVVYLNGSEIVRQNMPTGEITKNTEALTAVGGSDESNFTVYVVESELLKTGGNVIAVEIHQSGGNSSDISFDLELASNQTNTNSFINTNTNYTFTHTGELNLVAVFESDGSCVLPEAITAELVLDKSCSPYRVPDNVNVTKTGKLIINPGVELWISDDVSIEINGSIQANGTKNEPVIFSSNPDSKNQKWGILNFVNADTSYLKNVIIEDASKGYHPQREIAAVSAFNSTLRIDGAVIENVHENPIVARYSDISLKNSQLHSSITGDLINVKYGKGFIDSCHFIGNDMPDTDAIDYDDVENGVIQNSVIRDLHGFNSDGIDIGEQAQNITIKNMLVYNITDKGVSVGQQSSVNISNSIFVNCNLGAGLKDSSNINIDHCTYYGNGTSISCFEKNAGDAGGNAIVTNSILSNAYDKTYSSDAMSTLKISHSASDNDALPAGRNNLFVNPEFKNPNLFDFSLEVASACNNAGTSGNMGATLEINDNLNQLFISGLAYKSNLISEVIEFIVLTNSGNTDLNLSEFAFTKGITFQFPEYALIHAKQSIYISNNSSSTFWLGKGLTVYQWESGHLADEGEGIQLETPQGIIVDYIYYNRDITWPEANEGEGISLIADNLDNHFGTNWKIVSLNTLVGVNDMDGVETELIFYPNPTSGILTISGLKMEETLLNLYNLSGVLVKSQIVSSTNSQINLANLNQGVYIIRCGNTSQRLVLLK